MKTVTCLLLAVLGWAVTGLAQQEPVRPEEQVPEADPRDVRRSSDDSAATVIDRILRGQRNRFGFSAGAYEAYSSNLFNSSLLQQDGAMTALFPSIFTNFARGKNRFHADYTFGYRFYNNGKRPNTDQHRANLNYEVPLSRRARFTLYDRLDYAPNDSVSWFDPNTPGDFAPGYQPPSEYLLAIQKVFRNDAAASLGLQVSRGGSLSATVGYQVYQYDLQSAYDMSGVYGSVTYSHRIAEWLSISSSYTAYFTGTSSQYRDNQVQTVQVGNFQFSLSRTWKVHLAGGVDYSGGGSGQGSRTVANANAGITHRTSSNRLALEYHRGMSTVFGQPGLYQTDTGTFSFVQRLSRWTSIQASGNYQRGADYYSSGHYEYYWATTSLQFGLRNDLVASVNYSYRNQKSSGLGAEAWDFGRHVIYAGLAYFWPIRQN